jgi:hypothetical protein
LKTPIGVEAIVEIVYEQNGPDDLKKFLMSYVEPEEKKFELASRLKLYDLAIDSLAILKDK